MTEKIRVALISYRNGTIARAAYSEPGLMRELADWAKEYWDELDEPYRSLDPATMDDVEVVSTYFDNHPDETVDIDRDVELAD